jgi:hypothetical protein
LIDSGDHNRSRLILRCIGGHNYRIGMTQTTTLYRYKLPPKSCYRPKCCTATATKSLHHRTVPHHYRIEIDRFHGITATKSSNYRYMLSEKSQQRSEDTEITAWKSSRNGTPALSLGCPVVPH